MLDNHNETQKQFTQRKLDHLRLSLDDSNEALGLNGLSRVELVHEALPDFDFEEINISQNNSQLGQLKTPFLVSSMTAGHHDSVNLNQLLAKACEEKSWLMGVGSQRKELFNQEARNEWKKVRAVAPQVKLLGNLGITQLIQTPMDKVKELIDSLEATAMIVHTNPLQEALQGEGTPHFKDSLITLEKVSNELDVPVILKETGCGFSKKTIQKISETGVAVVDVSGFGGTHWGRIEGARLDKESVDYQVAKTFDNWGISTVDSLVGATSLETSLELWASGGVKTGLDVAKLISLGAKVVGFAKPILQAATESEEALLNKMEIIEKELKVAMLCTGSQKLEDLNGKGNVR